MHTLCLLDIKVKEPDFAKMARGKVSYLPPRYMSVSEAVRIVKHTTSLFVPIKDHSVVVSVYFGDRMNLYASDAERQNFRQLFCSCFVVFLCFCFFVLRIDVEQ